MNNNNFQDVSNAPKIRMVDDSAHVPKNNNPKIKILPKLQQSNPPLNPNPYVQPQQPFQANNQQPTQIFPSFGQQQQPQFQVPVYIPQNNFPIQQNQPQNQQFMPQNNLSQFNDQPAFIKQQSPVKQDNPFIYTPPQTQQTQQHNTNPSYQQEKQSMMFPMAAGVMHFDSNRNSVPTRVNESPIYEQKSQQQQKQVSYNAPIYTQQQTQKNSQLPSWQLTELERDELSIRVLKAFQQADENRRLKQKNR